MDLDIANSESWQMVVVMKSLPRDGQGKHLE